MDKGPFKDSIVAQLLKLSSFWGTLKHWEPLNDSNSIQIVLWSYFHRLRTNFKSVSIVFLYNKVLYHSLYSIDINYVLIIIRAYISVLIKSLYEETTYYHLKAVYWRPSKPVDHHWWFLTLWVVSLAVWQDWWFRNYLNLIQ